MATIGERDLEPGMESGEGGSSGVARPFYLNVVILNSEEVVESKVKQKMAGKGPRFARGLATKAAMSVAKKQVAPDTVTKEAAKQLAVKIPDAVRAMGIGMKFDCKLIRDALMVMRCEVTEVDSLPLLKKAKGEEFASKFVEMVDCFEYLGIQKGLSVVDQTIKAKATEGLMDKLGTLLPEKMGEQGIKIDCSTVEESDEAEWLFSYWKAIAESG